MQENASTNNTMKIKSFLKKRVIQNVAASNPNS